MQGRVDLETVYYEAVADGVVLITLNRPEHGNGVVVELARELAQTIDLLEQDLDTRVLVLTGAGKVFCAGADLGAFRRYIDERLHVEQEPFNARVLFPVTQRLVTCSMPIVAAVNGGATAGGLDLSLACDIRIASRRAKMGETYIKLGLAPANGGTYFLPRLLGSGMAAELALTGDLVDAERALEIGLVNRIVEHDELLPAAIELAAKIASRPRRAIEATKQALRASWHTDLAGTMATTYWATAALQYTDDVSEGIDAAIEGRPPRYNRSVDSAP